MKFNHIYSGRSCMAKFSRNTLTLKFLVCHLSHYALQFTFVFLQLVIQWNNIHCIVHSLISKKANDLKFVIITKSLQNHREYIKTRTPPPTHTHEKDTLIIQAPKQSQLQQLGYHCHKETERYWRDKYLGEEYIKANGNKTPGVYQTPDCLCTVKSMTYTVTATVSPRHVTVSSTVHLFTSSSHRRHLSVNSCVYFQLIFRV